MAIKVRFQSFASPMMFLLCIMALCLVTVNAMPQDKSFQSENELIESVPKLSSYTSRSDAVSYHLRQINCTCNHWPRELTETHLCWLQDTSENNDIAETADGRALYNKILTMIERKKMPTNWLIHQALMSGQHKRQIRYQQCYFNPISCF